MTRHHLTPWRHAALSHRHSLFAAMPGAATDDGAGPRASVTVATREESAVVAALLSSLAVLASLLIGRWAPRKYLSGCGVAALLGLALGFAALVSSWLHHGWLPLRLAFDSASFFTYLLPPIIFDAGMRVNIRQFVAKSRLPYILILGLAGTVASCAVVSLLASLIHPAGMSLSLRSQLALGAVFAATDTVATLSVLSPTAAPRLFAIVLGEGCTNDAISLVLLRAVESMPADGGNLSWQLLALVVSFGWLLLASTAIGICTGLVAALVARLTASQSASDDDDGANVDLETALFYLLAYLSFLLAEAWHLSGILSLFVCSLTMKHYAVRALSRQARHSALHSVATLAFVCEQLIFLQSGMAVLDMRIWRLAHGLEVLTLVITLGSALLVVRAAMVFPALALGNAVGRRDTEPLSLRECAVVWWAGSTRGAVSLAIATHAFDINQRGASPDDRSTNASVIGASLLIVLISSTVFSGLTQPFLRRVLPTAMAGASPGGSVLGNGADCADDDLADSNSWLARTWRRIDDRYLAPVLEGSSLPSSGVCSPPSVGNLELLDRTTDAPGDGREGGAWE